MISQNELTKFKIILLKDYDWSGDDKTASQLANDFLISLEAVFSGSKVDKAPKKGAK